ncbi:MAG: DUF2723 domain-containing protein [Elusimicrobia bacterium]|nr:DUF2723 domain-containing protein [Elusimicrobiota bacterium]
MSEGFYTVSEANRERAAYVSVPLPDTSAARVMPRTIIAALIAAFAFLFYVRGASGELAAYRDTGELAAVCATLSVAHPPGYPSYAIMGKFFNTAILSGNPAYRTKLMSAFFAAASAALFYLLFIRMGIPDISSAALCLVFVFSKVNWLLAIVSESYSPDLFFILILFYTAYFLKSYPDKLFAFAFIAGLSMGVRPTPVLALPSFALIFLTKHSIRMSDYVKAFLFFLAGSFVFLYLPVRSLANPPIDWADPQTLQQFIYSVTRKAYGHGLDKISDFYTLKETFFPQLYIFFKNLFFQFTPLLFFAGIAGIVRGVKNNLLIKSLFIFFIVTGPVFLFISRMPANEHALVIVEAAYLIPFACFFVFAAYGIKKIPAVYSAPAVLFCGAWLLFANEGEMNHRRDFFARDWAENVFVSAPQGSSVMLRKDVQLFSLWYENMARGKREDSLFLAQGMMRAPWYRKQLLRGCGIILPSLEIEGDDFFKEFILLNEKVYITNHFEAGKNFFSEMKPRSAGVLRGFGSGPVQNPLERMFFSGELSSMFYKDFYAKELCGDYSDAFSAKGLEFYSKKDFDAAEIYFRKAVAFHPYNSSALYNLAACFYERKKYEDSLRYYGFSRLALSREYRDKRSAPFIDNALARNYNNTGAVYEKLGKDDDALDCYKKSVEKDPAFAQGYYNCGVVYWKKKEWPKVILSFEDCLRADPQNRQARHYLEMLKREK